MNRATHPIEQEEVMAYLDGEATPERAAAVAAHLRECAECAALAADLRGVWQHMAAWQVEPAPVPLAQNVAAAASQPRPTAEKLPSPARVPPPAVAGLRRWVLAFAGGLAAVLLLLAVSVPNLLRSPRMAANEARYPLEEISPESGASRLGAPKSGTPQSRGNSEGEANKGLQAFAGPMIVRTASLVLVAKDFDATRAAVERLVKANGAYLAQLQTTGARNAGRSLSVTVRAPAERLDILLGELKKLGRVEQESQSGDEVTQQYVDLTARLKNARSTEQRLVEVLQQRTGKVRDVLEVEREIARVREEIERMDAQRKSLENQVRFATIDLRVQEDYQAPLEAAPPSTGTLLGNALVEGYRGAVETAIGLAWFVLRYGPSLLLWGLLLFWPVRRAWRWVQAHAG